MEHLVILLGGDHPLGLGLDDGDPEAALRLGRHRVRSHGRLHVLLAGHLGVLLHGRYLAHLLGLLVHYLERLLRPSGRHDVQLLRRLGGRPPERHGVLRQGRSRLPARHLRCRGRSRDS